MEKIYKFDLCELMSEYDFLYDEIENELVDFDNEKQGLDVSVVVKVRNR